MAGAGKADELGMASHGRGQLVGHGRVSAPADPLTIRVGQPTRLALERASNGPMANEVLPMRVRSMPDALAARGLLPHEFLAGLQGPLDLADVSWRLAPG